MSVDLPGDNALPGVVTDQNGRLILSLDQEDAAEIIERLRETHADAMGRAYLLRLDLFVEQLGAKWESKRDLVFDHLKTAFERRFPEPDWCIRINDDAFLVVILTLGEHKGALSAAELWYTAGQFFIGDVSKVQPSLFEAIAHDVDRMRIVPIDVNTYFDRTEARPFREAARPVASASQETAPQGPSAVGTATSIRRAGIAGGTLITIAGRSLRIASSVEPVFEMRKLSMIGHRLEPIVTDAIGNLSLDSRSITALDWGDREQVDIASIEQGLKVLQMRSPEQRKIIMIVPAAFSTFSSARARGRITTAVTQAAQEMGLKVLYEVRNLNGVPTGRVMEIAGMLKPFCMTVVGHAGADTKAIAALKGCGLAGTAIDYDGNKRDDSALEVYLSHLSNAAKSATGACMIHGFDTLRQMATARLAGVTHASVKSSGLVAARKS
jgi:hypothetical protein